ncbi:hypothetical protein HELRODRAFT_190271 [Helobdella robusta]|uniref:C2H2-type domain-containing protein n=1 Tax=Helobdella robusta TaxID=6412 RepID=T1FRU5_HELRO|nr:hypothetical protein HELRODRAFT_190271 [Helobdella robusta]ESO11013.1 hypothetical protein HELRODRAFT_190271 [Helobdella robusta]
MSEQFELDVVNIFERNPTPETEADVVLVGQTSSNLLPQRHVAPTLSSLSTLSSPSSPSSPPSKPTTLQTSEAPSDVDIHFNGDLVTASTAVTLTTLPVTATTTLMIMRNDYNSTNDYIDINNNNIVDTDRQIVSSSTAVYIHPMITATTTTLISATATTFSTLSASIAHFTSQTSPTMASSCTSLLSLTLPSTSSSSSSLTSSNFLLTSSQSLISTKTSSTSSPLSATSSTTTSPDLNLSNISPLTYYNNNSNNVNNNNSTTSVGINKKKQKNLNDIIIKMLNDNAKSTNNNVNTVEDSINNINNNDNVNVADNNNDNVNVINDIQNQPNINDDNTLITSNNENNKKIIDVRASDDDRHIEDGANFKNHCHSAEFYLHNNTSLIGHITTNTTAATTFTATTAAAAESVALPGATTENTWSTIATFAAATFTTANSTTATTDYVDNLSPSSTIATLSFITSTTTDSAITSNTALTTLNVLDAESNFVDATTAATTTTTAAAATFSNAIAPSNSNDNMDYEGDDDDDDDDYGNLEIHVDDCSDEDDEEEKEDAEVVTAADKNDNMKQYKSISCLTDDVKDGDGDAGIDSNDDNGIASRCKLNNHNIVNDDDDNIKVSDGAIISDHDDDDDNNNNNNNNDDDDDEERNSNINGKDQTSLMTVRKIAVDPKLDDANDDEDDNDDDIGDCDDNTKNDINNNNDDDDDDRNCHQKNDKHKIDEGNDKKDDDDKNVDGDDDYEDNDGVIINNETLKNVSEKIPDDDDDSVCEKTRCNSIINSTVAAADDDDNHNNNNDNNYIIHADDDINSTTLLLERQDDINYDVDVLDVTAKSMGSVSAASNDNSTNDNNNNICNTIVNDTKTNHNNNIDNNNNSVDIAATTTTTTASATVSDLQIESVFQRLAVDDSCYDNDEALGNVIITNTSSGSSSNSGSSSSSGGGGYCNAAKVLTNYVSNSIVIDGLNYNDINVCPDSINNINIVNVINNSYNCRAVDDTNSSNNKSNLVDSSINNNINSVSDSINVDVIDVVDVHGDINKNTNHSIGNINNNKLDYDNKDDDDKCGKNNANDDNEDDDDDEEDDDIHVDDDISDENNVINHIYDHRTNINDHYNARNNNNNNNISEKSKDDDDDDNKNDNNDDDNNDIINNINEDGNNIEKPNRNKINNDNKNDEDDENDVHTVSKNDNKTVNDDEGGGGNNGGNDEDDGVLNLVVESKGSASELDRYLPNNTEGDSSINYNYYNNFYFNNNNNNSNNNNDNNNVSDNINVHHNNGDDGDDDKDDEEVSRANNRAGTKALEKNKIDEDDDDYGNDDEDVGDNDGKKKKISGDGNYKNDNFSLALHYHQQQQHQQQQQHHQQYQQQQQQMLESSFQKWQQHQQHLHPYHNLYQQQQHLFQQAQQQFYQQQLQHREQQQHQPSSTHATTDDTVTTTTQSWTPTTSFTSYTVATTSLQQAPSSSFSNTFSSSTSSTSSLSTSATINRSHLSPTSDFYQKETAKTKSMWRDKYLAEDSGMNFTSFSSIFRLEQCINSIAFNQQQLNNSCGSSGVGNGGRKKAEKLKLSADVARELQSFRMSLKMLGSADTNNNNTGINSGTNNINSNYSNDMAMYNSFDGYSQSNLPNYQTPKSSNKVVDDESKTAKSHKKKTSRKGKKSKDSESLLQDEALTATTATTPHVEAAKNCSNVSQTSQNVIPSKDIDGGDSKKSKAKKSRSRKKSKNDNSVETLTTTTPTSVVAAALVPATNTNATSGIVYNYNNSSFLDNGNNNNNINDCNNIDINIAVTPDVMSCQSEVAPTSGRNVKNKKSSSSSTRKSSCSSRRSKKKSNKNDGISLSTNDNIGDAVNNNGDVSDNNGDGDNVISDRRMSENIIYNKSSSSSGSNKIIKTFDYNNYNDDTLDNNNNSNNNIDHSSSNLDKSEASKKKKDRKRSKRKSSRSQKLGQGHSEEVECQDQGKSFLKSSEVEAAEKFSRRVKDVDSNVENNVDIFGNDNNKNDNDDDDDDNLSKVGTASAISTANITKGDNDNNNNNNNNDNNYNDYNNTGNSNRNYYANYDDANFNMVGHHHSSRHMYPSILNCDDNQNNVVAVTNNYTATTTTTTTCNNNNNNISAIDVVANDVNTNTSKDSRTSMTSTNSKNNAIPFFYDPSKTYFCLTCSYKVKRKGQLMKHLINSHNMYICTHCNSNFDSREQLNGHLILVHPSRFGRRLCKRCHGLFRVQEVDEHETSCSGEKQGWACDICGKKFRFVSLLKNHVDKAHKGVGDVHCNDSVEEIEDGGSAVEESLIKSDSDNKKKNDAKVSGISSAKSKKVSKKSKGNLNYLDDKEDEAKKENDKSSSVSKMADDVNDTRKCILQHETDVSPPIITMINASSAPMSSSPFSSSSPPPLPLNSSFSPFSPNSATLSPLPSSPKPPKLHKTKSMKPQSLESFQKKQQPSQPPPPQLIPTTPMYTPSGRKIKFFQCEHCPKFYRSMQSLKNHKLKNHVNDDGNNVKSLNISAAVDATPHMSADINAVSITTTTTTATTANTNNNSNDTIANNESSFNNTSCIAAVTNSINASTSITYATPVATATVDDDDDHVPPADDKMSGSYSVHDRSDSNTLNSFLEKICPGDVDNLPLSSSVADNKVTDDNLNNENYDFDSVKMNEQGKDITLAEQQNKVGSKDKKVKKRSKSSKKNLSNSTEQLSICTDQLTMAAANSLSSPEPVGPYLPVVTTPPPSSHLPLADGWFQCSYETCLKKFRKLEQVQKHEEKHPIDKIYKCDWPGCRKAYIHYANMYSHRSHHITAKPFICHVCSNAYWQKCSLNSHKARVHGIKNIINNVSTSAAASKDNEDGDDGANLSDYAQNEGSVKVDEKKISDESLPGSAASVKENGDSLNQTRQSSTVKPKKSRSKKSKKSIEVIEHAEPAVVKGMDESIKTAVVAGQKDVILNDDDDDSKTITSLSSEHANDICATTVETHNNSNKQLSFENLLPVDTGRISDDNAPGTDQSKNNEEENAKELKSRNNKRKYIRKSKQTDEKANSVKSKNKKCKKAKQEMVAECLMGDKQLDVQPVPTLNDSSDNTEIQTAENFENIQEMHDGQDDDHSTIEPSVSAVKEKPKRRTKCLFNSTKRRKNKRQKKEDLIIVDIHDEYVTQTDFNYANEENAMLETIADGSVTVSTIKVTKEFLTESVNEVSDNFAVNHIIPPLAKSEDNETGKFKNIYEFNESESETTATFKTTESKQKVKKKRTKSKEKPKSTKSLQPTSPSHHQSMEVEESINVDFLPSREGFEPQKTYLDRKRNNSMRSNEESNNHFSSESDIDFKDSTRTKAKLKRKLKAADLSRREEISSKRLKSNETEHLNVIKSNSKTTAADSSESDRCGNEGNVNPASTVASQDNSEHMSGKKIAKRRKNEVEVLLEDTLSRPAEKHPQNNRMSRRNQSFNYEPHSSTRHNSKSEENKEDKNHCKSSAAPAPASNKPENKKAVSHKVHVSTENSEVDASKIIEADNDKNADNISNVSDRPSSVSKLAKRRAEFTHERFSIDASDVKNAAKEKLLESLQANDANDVEREPSSEVGSKVDSFKNYSTISGCEELEKVPASRVDENSKTNVAVPMHNDPAGSIRSLTESSSSPTFSSRNLILKLKIKEVTRTNQSDRDDNKVVTLMNVSNLSEVSQQHDDDNSGNKSGATLQNSLQFVVADSTSEHHNVEDYFESYRPRNTAVEFDADPNEPTNNTGSTGDNDSQLSLIDSLEYLRITESVRQVDREIVAPDENNGGSENCEKQLSINADEDTATSGDHKIIENKMACVPDKNLHDENISESKVRKADTPAGNEEEDKNNVQPNYQEGNELEIERSQNELCGSKSDSEDQHCKDASSRNIFDKDGYGNNFDDMDDNEGYLRSVEPPATWRNYEYDDNNAYHRSSTTHESTKADEEESTSNVNSLQLNSDVNIDYTEDGGQQSKKYHLYHRNLNHSPESYLDKISVDDDNNNNNNNNSNNNTHHAAVDHQQQQRLHHEESERQQRSVSNDDSESNVNINDDIVVSSRSPCQKDENFDLVKSDSEEKSKINNDYTINKDIATKQLETNLDHSEHFSHKPLPKHTPDVSYHHKLSVENLADGQGYSSSTSILQQLTTAPSSSSSSSLIPRPPPTPSAIPTYPGESQKYDLASDKKFHPYPMSSLESLASLAPPNSNYFESDRRLPSNDRLHSDVSLHAPPFPSNTPYSNFPNYEAILSANRHKSYRYNDRPFDASIAAAYERPHPDFHYPQHPSPYYHHHPNFATDPRLFSQFLQSADPAAIDHQQRYYASQHAQNPGFADFQRGSSAASSGGTMFPMDGRRSGGFLPGGLTSASFTSLLAGSPYPSSIHDSYLSSIYSQQSYNNNLNSAAVAGSSSSSSNSNKNDHWSRNERPWTAAPQTDLSLYNQQSQQPQQPPQLNTNNSNNAANNNNGSVAGGSRKTSISSNEFNSPNHQSVTNTGSKKNSSRSTKNQDQTFYPASNSSNSTNNRSNNNNNNNNSYNYNNNNNTNSANMTSPRPNRNLATPGLVIPPPHPQKRLEEAYRHAAAAMGTSEHHGNQTPSAHHSPFMQQPPITPTPDPYVDPAAAFSGFNRYYYSAARDAVYRSQQRPHTAALQHQLQQQQQSAPLSPFSNAMNFASGLASSSDNFNPHVNASTTPNLLPGTTTTNNNNNMNNNNNSSNNNYPQAKTPAFSHHHHHHHQQQQQPQQNFHPNDNNNSSSNSNTNNVGRQHQSSNKSTNKSYNNANNNNNNASNNTNSNNSSNNANKIALPTSSGGFLNSNPQEFENAGNHISSDPYRQSVIYNMMPKYF